MTTDQKVGGSSPFECAVIIFNIYHNMDELQSLYHKTAKDLLYIIGDSQITQKLINRCIYGNKKQFIHLLNRLNYLTQNTKLCSICNFIYFNNQCIICNNKKRANDILCITDSIEKALSIEKSGIYNGIYYIIGGLIQNRLKITPSGLKLSKILIMLKTYNKIKEIIFCIPSTFNGDLTMNYLKNDIMNFNTKYHLSRINNIPEYHISDRALSKQVNIAFKERISID